MNPLPISSRCRARRVVALVFSLLVAPAFADVEPLYKFPAAHNPSGTVSLRQAIGLVLSNHPSLATFTLDVRVAEAKMIQAGLKPNPQLNVTAENLPGSGPYKDIGDPDTQKFAESTGARQNLVNPPGDFRSADEKSFDLASLLGNGAPCAAWLPFCSYFASGCLFPRSAGLCNSAFMTARFFCRGFNPVVKPKPLAMGPNAVIDAEKGSTSKRRPRAVWMLERCPTGQPQQVRSRYRHLSLWWLSR